MLIKFNDVLLSFMLFASCHRSITRSYYRNSVGALLLYDISRRSSFDHLVDWLFEVRRHIEPSKAVYQVVACKTDVHGEREITTEEGKAFADFYNIKFVETSAKTRHNIDLAFKMIAEDIYDKIKTGAFQLDDGWEGIRSGQTANLELSSRSFLSNGSNGYSPRRPQNGANGNAAQSNDSKCSC